jgi:uncharacterized delta-60 repeat protein
MLKFSIDGSVYESISGVTSWEERVFTLAAGTRTLRWEYTKDWRSAQNLDRGWIDDITVTNVAAVDYNTKYICTGYTGEGSCPSGSGNSVTFPIMQSSSVTWLWKTVYRLSVSATPSAGGTVTAEPLSGDSYYDPGTVVTLTANANAGYEFAHWTGDLSGSDNPAILTMDSGKIVTANFPVIPWAKSYGGGYSEWAKSIQQTSDGGYIAAGSTWSFAAGYYDFWVVKLNGIGTVLWQKAYGGTDYDYAYSIHQTSDGGYIVTGYTWSFGAGNYDLWVLKLNSAGTIAWQTTYGGIGYDDAESIRQTSDGGYIVAGETYDSGTGCWHFWVLKLNSNGTVAWQKRYGGAYWDEAKSIQQTSDGGYIVAGWTQSFDPFCDDVWVLKLNSDGTVAWQKRYAGADFDYPYSIQQTRDGGYIVAGFTYSFDTDDYDYWVLKLNSNGSVAWQKRYGGTEPEHAHSVYPTSDGGYIVAGHTQSFGAICDDAWVLKLNSDGTVAWQKRYGGTDYDYAYSIQQTSDGGYIVGGETRSFGAGYSDVWVLKLNSAGTILFNPASGAHVTDTNAVPVDTNCTVANTTATVANTSATVTDTDATVTDTDATVEQQAP